VLSAAILIIRRHEILPLLKRLVTDPRFIAFTQGHA
jgi:hypothetical protein